MVTSNNEFDLEYFLSQSEEDLPSMEELMGETKNYAEGRIVSGIIVSIDKAEILVDIGYKSEGIVPKYEFKYDNNLTLGREINVLIESLEDSEGRIILSKIKADKVRQWDETVNSFEEGSIVSGRVSRKIKGGLIVDIGIDAFLPASQVDVRPVANFDDFVDKTYSFKIVKINAKRKNIVVSRREILEEERMRGREEILSKITVGDLRKGVVKNITDFGAFIDLGGLDGLLHITDMSWGRINHPSQMVTVCDTVEVMILDIDKEKGRVSLGLKQKTDNPWTKIPEKYPVGTRIKGKVVNLTHYGVFVEIEEGVEALLHISEMSWTRRVAHPSEILTVGDEIEAVVLSVNTSEHKLSLGLKQIQENPWDSVEEKFKEGMRLSGQVRNLTDYGAFVEIAEGIDGLIHVSDMSWAKRVNHPTEILKKGETIDAIVLSVDRDNKKIALGLKQLEEDPWETTVLNYKPNQEVQGKVVKLTKFGIFIVFDQGLEGLIHSSQLNIQGSKIEDVYKEGDDIRAYIGKVDLEQRKISLSTQSLAGAESVEDFAEEVDDEGA
jgi:small subunit ribosomal protein S1